MYVLPRPLYEYFRDELNRPSELEDIYVPTNFKRLKYQEEAVLSAKKVLEEYGGLFLSDVVLVTRRTDCKQIAAAQFEN